MSERENAQQQDLMDLLGEDGEQFKKPEPPPKPKITDAAKKKADELKVDLEKVKGTGRDGQITVGDVQKAAPRPEPKTAPPAGPKKEPDVYDKDRVLLYAGHRIEVPTREMKLEEVRQMAEEQFPELTKERTDMMYDEERGFVIPILKGHRKGAKTQPIAVHGAVPEDYDRRPVFYLLGDDGVYQVRSTQAGNFVARVETERTIREGAQLAVPQIWPEILAAVVDAFRKEPEIEMLANVMYSTLTGDYSVEFPEQKGTPASVTSKGRIETEETFIVLQVHSHGTLAPFWSTTDDADEIRTGFYGVIGRCDREIPEMRLRYSCGGAYRRLFGDDVFAEGYESYVEVLGE